MNITTTPEPIAYSRRDAAAALGICERVLFDLVSNGEIREIRIGRSVRVPRSELLRYVAKLLDNDSNSPMDESDHNVQ